MASIHDLVLINRSGREAFAEELLAAGEWLHWKTCVRQVLIGHRDWEFQAAPGDSVVYGVQAYAFLLEAICGLQSPLIGETEVYGQFKNHFLNYEYPQNPWAQFVKKQIVHLISDAKDVRTQYLTNLGSQSYGSVARRYTKGLESVHFIGGGQLVEEMLPWLSKANAVVNVFVRNPQKAQALAKPYHNVRVYSLSESQNYIQQGAVIVAAPLSSQEISQGLLGHQQDVEVVLDLRGEAEVDRVKVQARVVPLQEVFADLEKSKEVIQQKVFLAQQEIKKLAQERAKHVDNRPFGWDDLCA